MNFLILKTIIESTIQNYNIQNPTGKITEHNIAITGMAPNRLDMVITNPTTNQAINVRAEVNFMNGPLPTNFSIAGGGMQNVQGQINDNDVQQVHQALRSNASISDLFGADTK